MYTRWGICSRNKYILYKKLESKTLDLQNLIKKCYSDTVISNYITRYTAVAQIHKLDQNMTELYKLTLVL